MADDARRTNDDDARDVEPAGEGAPEAPVLLSPKEEALVDGTNVTLEWEALDDADGYLVEVAEDGPFHEVVVQQEVGANTTALELDALPTDGDLYYWRVITQRAGGNSHGDRIESFVSVTAEQARDSEDTPDKGEGYGPAAELFTSAGAEAAAEATGGEAAEQRLDKEREQGVAREGVESGQIMGFAGVVLVALVIIVCILLFWITSVADAQRDTLTETSVYPELRETETRAAQQLDQYELVSERDSTYRIPIGEAMRIVADEAYEQGPERQYSGELQRDLLPAAPADSLGAGAPAAVPEPSFPEGPAAP